MMQKEKIELKLEILEDIRSCIHFNFSAIDDTLSLSDLNEIIDKYKNILKGIEMSEN